MSKFFKFGKHKFEENGNAAVQNQNNQNDKENKEEVVFESVDDNAETVNGTAENVSDNAATEAQFSVNSEKETAYSDVTNENEIFDENNSAETKSETFESDMSDFKSARERLNEELGTLGGDVSENNENNENTENGEWSEPVEETENSSNAVENTVFQNATYGDKLTENSASNVNETKAEEYTEKSSGYNYDALHKEVKQGEVNEKKYSGGFEIPEKKAESADVQAKSMPVDMSKSEDTEELKNRYKNMKYKNIVSKIDLDCTAPVTTIADINVLADRAKNYGLGSVCVLAGRMKYFKTLAKTQAFCAVVGYPYGEMSEQAKINEIRDALRYGATSVDVFVRVSALKDEKPRQIAKSLAKYARAVGKKNTFKVSIDCSVLSKEEGKIIVNAAAEAKADCVVIRNCARNDARTQLYYADICGGKCKVEFADSADNLAAITGLTGVGTDRFLSKNAFELANSVRDDIEKEG